jgi:hypothetical protein
MNLSNSEQITHSTIRIEIINKNNEISSTGTGFFFYYKIQEKYHIEALATNKHVVRGAKKGKLAFTIGSEENNPKYGEKFSYIIDNFETSFIFHPDNEVDLCIMPMNRIFEDASKKHRKKLFRISLDESIIPSIDRLKELSVMEDVIMVGYPKGLWDEENNLPIIRRGITAIHPKFDYNGKKILF